MIYIYLFFTHLTHEKRPQISKISCQNYREEKTFVQ